MSLNSMTGFARSEGAFAGTTWCWEIRSVNGKGLDLRLRLPNGYEALDIPARNSLSKSFSRGNFQVSLQIAKTGGGLLPKVDHELAIAYFEHAKTLAGKTGGPLPTPAELLNMRGVVELEEDTLGDDEVADLHKSILGSLETAIDQLKQARGKEGASVGEVLRTQLDRLRDLHANISNSNERHPDTILQSLTELVAKLMDNHGLDTQRLHQEAVMLAAKADIQEELDRLNVHILSANELLEEGGPVGRKLDFFAQEFNRECNTICSKSNSATVTGLGLDMKLVIDQFREQVQNME